MSATASKAKKPRSIFRSRRDRPPPYVGLILKSATRARIRPGLHYARVWHHADCRKPRGGTCTCSVGEIDIELVEL
jgi:hypothetical protein